MATLKAEAALCLHMQSMQACPYDYFLQGHKKLMSTLLRLFLLAMCATGLLASFPARAHNALDNARQIVVVTTADWNSVSGTLQRFERDGSHDKWTAVGQPFPIVVGKAGLA